MTIDWSSSDRFSEMTCTCVCGSVFRSHAKFVVGAGLVSRKPCPRCSGTKLNRASSDAESVVIGKKDVGSI